MAQPHKGERHQVKTRVPEAAYQRLRSDAQSRDVPVSEMAAAIIAQHYDLGHLVQIPEPREGLPLTG